MVEYHSMNQNTSPDSPIVPDAAPASLREQHHAVTRQAILRAARVLFAERGFARSSVKAIAERAGVAIQTIYATFGSKAGVAMALVDLVDQEAGVLELAQQLAQLDDPRALVRTYARLRRQIRERSGDLIRTLRQGAALEPEMAEVWGEGMRRRHAGLERMTARLDAQQALKEGLSPARAAAVAAALVTDDACDVLVEQRGWTFDEYEAWLGDTLATLLLK
jgi:AcrR family transcriptional regulator